MAWRLLAVRRWLPALLLCGLPLAAGAAPGGEAPTQQEAAPLPTMTPEELENYPFDIEEEAPLVGSLSIGQRFHLSRQRREASELFARHLGILSLQGDSRDLPALQRLIDKQVIDPGDVRLWQSLGVLFGDILAADFGLDWVSYEDDLGLSKALRWQQTENYIFPITVFSKRIQFKEEIQVQPLYQTLAATIAGFQAEAAESLPRRPRFE